MQEKSTPAFARITGAILLLLGIIVFPLAVGLLLTLPASTGIWGLMLLVSCIFFWKSAYDKFNQAKLLADRLDRAILAKYIEGNKKVDPQAQNEERIVLGEWKIDGIQWKKFIEWESKEQKANIFGEAFWVLVLGTPLLIFTRATSWVMALIFSGFFAVLYGLIKFRFVMKGFPKGNEGVSIVLTKHFADLSGHIIFYHDGRKWVEQVEIKNCEGLLVLEIVYAWTTRRGPTSHELRLPFSEEQRPTVQKIADQLKQSLFQNK
ncbi:MAG: hypothetical protein MH132_08565 [Hydrotalea sp.]|nr:hypothetical protein [Hydrotalea sp.]